MNIQKDTDDWKLDTGVSPHMKNEILAIWVFE